MKDLVEFIARSIVLYPDEVKVTEEAENGRVVLTLEVNPDDKGKVIGRHGRVAESIRTLLRVSAVKRGTRTTLDIV